MAAAQEAMNDYRRVRVEPGFRRCRPADTLRWHRASARWFAELLAEPFAEPFAGPTAVVTHHAPSRHSLAPAAATPGDTHPLAAAYDSNLDKLVAGSGAALWAHGHTHRHADYALGATRVRSNPRGYPDERVDACDPGLVV